MAKTYSDEFKQQCVNSIIKNQMTIQAASVEFNAGKRSLVTWLNLHEQGKLVPKKTALDEEKIKYLECENKRLVQENNRLTAQLKLFSSLVKKYI